MRRVTFALAFALALGSFAPAGSAAPTDGQQPAATSPTVPTAKPARLSPLQRALRACAKMKDETTKADCQRRAGTQASKTPRKATTAKRKPVPPAATPAAVSTN